MDLAAEMTDVPEKPSWNVKAERNMRQFEAKNLPAWPSPDGTQGLARLRSFTWRLFEQPTESLGSYYINWYIILLIIFGTLATILETIPGVHKTIDFFGHFETVCVINFTAEFVLRVLSCPNHCDFVMTFMNWIDFLSIIPFYMDLIVSDTGVNLQILRLFRTFRGVRLMKIGRYSSGLRLIQTSFKRSTDALQLFAMIFAIMIIMFSSAMFYSENETFDEDRKEYLRTVQRTEKEEISPWQGIIECVWWTIVTLATVGYGDVYPVTTGGYIVGITAQLIGVLMLALPLSIIGASFHEERGKMQQETEDAQAAMENNQRGALDVFNESLTLAEACIGDLEVVLLKIAECCCTVEDISSLPRFKLRGGTLIERHKRVPKHIEGTEVEMKEVGEEMKEVGVDVVEVRKVGDEEPYLYVHKAVLDLLEARMAAASERARCIQFSMK